MKKYIENILTVASVFFDSIFKNEKILGTNKEKVLKLLLNLMYAAVISIPLGLILHFICFIAISSLTGFEVAKEVSLLIFPIFLFICLSGIVVLNYENQSFSLPREVLTSYIVIQIIKPVKGVWKPITFIAIITIPLMLTLTWFLSSFKIPEQYLKDTTVVLFIISLFISMIIYSEATKDKINRKKRQAIFSMLTFLAFFALNIYQIVVNINEDSSSEINMFIAITILGLILSMATAVDKTRCLFDTILKSKQVEIEDKWNMFNEKYSYRIGLKIVDDKRNEVDGAFQIIRTKWNTGDWKKRIEIIKNTSIFILAESFLIFCIFNQKKIQNQVDLFFIKTKELIIQIFNGDERRASLTITIIVMIVIIIWLFNDAKKKLKDSDFIYKIKLICRIEFTLLVLLACINQLLPVWSNFIDQYLIFPVAILFLVTIVITSIYLKLKKLKKKVRNQ